VQPSGMLAVRVVPDGVMSPPVPPPQARTIDFCATLRPSNLYRLLMTYVRVSALHCTVLTVVLPMVIAMATTMPTAMLLPACLVWLGCGPLEVLIVTPVEILIE
jgi:hypothetical protein